MKFGERYMDRPPSRFRCRAIATTGKQCTRQSTGITCGVAYCALHIQGTKEGKQWSYVIVP